MHARTYVVYACMCVHVHICVCVGNCTATSTLFVILVVKSGPSISVQPLQRLFTLPLTEVMSFLETVPTDNRPN